MSPEFLIQKENLLSLKVIQKKIANPYYTSTNLLIFALNGDGSNPFVKISAN
jgi:hypothetical protein